MSDTAAGAGQVAGLRNLSEVLDKALRFHLCLDASGVVVHLGPSLGKVFPGLLGSRLGDVAASNLRSVDLSKPPADSWIGENVRLEFTTPAFSLRGNFLPIALPSDSWLPSSQSPESQSVTSPSPTSPSPTSQSPTSELGWLFAASLDTEDAGRLKALGLVASDFAGADLTLDFAMLQWTRDAQVRATKSALTKLEESIAARDQLQIEVKTDPLTGIGNRSSFVKDVDDAIKAADGVGTAAVVMIDVDRFKSINDIHGHHAGDVALTAVADHLRNVVGPSGTAARLGGDEFAVLMTGFDDVGAIHELTSRLCEINGRVIQADRSRIALQITMGVAVLDTETDSRALLRHADIAMYAARRDNRSCIGWFDMSTQANLDLRRSIADDLLGAISARSIEPWFQPIVEMRTGIARGFEVLSRWRHPVHGFVPPDVFVDVAEQCKLVKELDHYVIRQAIGAAGDLAADGELPQLSVNFSALSLDDELVSVVADVLGAHEFPASKLTVEVTETAAIGDLSGTAATLEALTAMGAKISLDDFGTGFSSLSYLHELPIQLLKVDRSFVAAMLESHKAFELIRSILHVARALDLPVVAEGIETSDQRVMLSNLGCELGQGYFFARPAPLHEAATLAGQALPLRQLASEQSGVAQRPVAIAD